MDLLEDLDNKQTSSPLADLLRPRSLDEVAGQEHLLSGNAPFRRAMEEGVLGSFILWGPPGSGKTTLILLVSGQTGQNFVRFSAVTGGVKQVRMIVEDAARLRRQGISTLLFVDEIHRFNKAQQDAFLPHVEDGTIALAGATTENPSFEIIAPLLSRCTVYVLRRLEKEHIVSILGRALRHPAFVDMNPGGVQPEVLDDIASYADGDGRRALNMLELLAGLASGGRVDRELFKEAAASSPLSYDKSGEEHYNLISALHKSLRSSDVDASLYWLARMIQSGENPLYIARRMIRFATEDVGLADPSALTVAMRAADSYRFLGSPEGDLALAEAACYLALAPKSNAVYAAWGKAVAAARGGGSLPVPLHLRNAPTELMKELDYGRDYQYAHERPGGVVTHPNFPSGMDEQEFYSPSDAGKEAAIAQKLARWKDIRSRARADEEAGKNVRS
jgi:putative ATPase